MAEQFGEKSQEATPHRRQKAREEGQVAKSQDLSSAVLLLGALAILLYWGGAVCDLLGRLAQRQLGGPAWITIDSQFAVSQWHGMTLEVAKILGPIFALLVIVAVLANVLQTGILFVPKKLALDFNRINPIAGLKRTFSLTSVMRLLFGIFKIAVVAAVAAWSVSGDYDTILSLATLELPQVAAFIGKVTLWTCGKIALALLVLAVIEFAYQRWKYEQDLRMTSQEVREEFKQTQGDPQIIARRRMVQRQLVLNRLSSAVPKADVIVTNPTELAIALQYDPQTMVAPLVVAKGAGVVAQRIRRLGLENGVPIVERKELAQTLYKHVEVNQAIPREQYAAVAEVLRYVYELKGESPPGLAA